MQNGNTIIDFHVHLPRYEGITKSAYAWFTQAFPSAAAYEAFCDVYESPDAFLALMDANGVDYSVVLAEVTPFTTGIATNERVAAFCAGHARLIPFCTFPRPFLPEAGAQLKTLCAEYGFRGIKLYPTYNHFYSNDPALYPLYAEAEQQSLPVLFHTGSSVFENSRIKYGNPIFLDDVAVDFPSLKIVMAHGGRGPWYEEAFTMVRLHKNVFIDVAGLPPQKLPEYFPELERFAHKFVFGTDWPGADVKKNIEKIRQLPVSQDAVRKILGANAMELLLLP